MTIGKPNLDKMIIIILVRIYLRWRILMTI